MRMNLRTVVLLVICTLLLLWLRITMFSLNPSSALTSPLPVTSRPLLDHRDGANRVIMDDSEAVRLKKKVRVLVWVMTSPKTYDRAHVVNITWGQRVDKGLLLFFSSKEDRRLPTIALKVSEGRNHLTAKTMQAFDHVYRHYFHKADFFMKADDDTYVVMENLRYFLSHLDPDEAFITGRHFRHYVKQGFPSGGAGYVVSKGALAKLANRSKDPPLCKEDGSGEDVHLGGCMENLGVPLLNSSDLLGRSRFHPYTPIQHFVRGLPGNYQHWDANVVRVGPHAVNEYPISFHYVKPDDMKMMHYYFYHMRLYGISHNYTSDGAT